MVKLRLRRMGKKKRPFYRIVAADIRAPRDGRFIEMIGTYDPIKKPHEIKLNEDRIIYWLQNGAQPTDTVKSLFRRKGLWLKWDLMRRGVEEQKIEDELKKWEVMQLERERRVAQETTQKPKKEEPKEEESKAEDKDKKEEKKKEKTEAQPTEAGEEEQTGQSEEDVNSKEEAQAQQEEKAD